MRDHADPTRESAASPVDRPWRQTAQAVLAALDVRPAQGLTERDALNRRLRYGANRLRETMRKSAWRILAAQFVNVMVALLAAAAAISFVLADWIQGLAILAVVMINAAMGFATELRAVRSMEALHRLGRVGARVRRGNQVREIGADALVPGDIVVVEGGDVVSADLRLVTASNLQADESTLTGESLPVDKRVEPAPDDALLAERSSMLFKGTAVTRGAGEAVVVGTGRATELGRIADLVRETPEETTPLERRLERLSLRLVWLTLAIAAALATTGILMGKDVVNMVETAIALAVATVPEGLPVVATIALARGMWRMARRNALVNRLAAVETLGTTNVICTDKTGTLTENRMSVACLALPAGDVDVGRAEDGFTRQGKPIDAGRDPALREALEIGVLCSNATLSDQGGTGDPMEIALLAAGRRAGLGRNALEAAQPRVREEAFATETTMMATYHRTDRGFRVAVKGAPEAVLNACGSIRDGAASAPLDAATRDAWLARNASLAAEGLRVIALAAKSAGTLDEEPYASLAFVGLVGLRDPPRTDVRDAIRQCRAAGIRVVMVTGDQPATARSIARELGIAEPDAEVVSGRDMAPFDELPESARERLRNAAIFARVSPAQKLDLIAVHQAAGAVVAMTGDGVNDAPALKKADIGIAMGQRGTQVAREAADMVLKDDAFATIVAAVRQGRAIFGNIRKFVLYLLSCNVSEVMVVGLATAANAPLPLVPLQILFLNIVTDVFPALALGVGGEEAAAMRRPPRRADEHILARDHWIAVALYGALITAAVLGVFAIALAWQGRSERDAITLAFLTLALAQLWHVFNMRDPDAGVLRNAVTRNPYVWGALALCVALVAAALYVPWLAQLLQLEPPDPGGLALAFGASLVPLAGGFVVKAAGLP